MSLNYRRTHWLSRLRQSWCERRGRNAIPKALAGLAMVVAAGFSMADQAQAQVKPNAGMMRFPDVSADSITFVYADDLWIVSRDGGMARPLASPEGAETFPKFSDDGSTIAFVGNYDGDRDLYTISSLGGNAVRHTYQAADEQLCDWMPGNKLLYSTNGYSGLGRVTELYSVSTENGPPTKIGVPYGSNGAISSDGTWLAYTPHSRDFRTWKRYRGGMASDIWLYNLKNNTSKQVTDWEGTDTLPMWHGQMLYYLSDQGPQEKLNIWMYDTTTGARKQITKFAEYDCKFPSIGPGPEGKGEIVLQNGPALHLIDLATGESKTVDVTIPGDQPRLRNQRIDASEYIQGGDVSPSGKLVTVEARGDIWTVPVKNGTPRNLTHSSDAAERSPAWSPDGRWIAYLSDITGEYELYVTQSDGKGETKRLTNDGNCFKYAPTWSPDSKHIVFDDKTGTLWMYSFEGESLKKVDQDPYGGRLTPSWSHDSGWLVYTRTHDSESRASAIFVYHVESGESHQLTSGFFSDNSVTFDRKGEYIYFSSNRSFNSPKYEDLGTTWIYDQTEVLMAMPLRADVKNPMMPKVDTETWKDDKAEEKKEGEDKKEDAADDKKSDAKDGEASPSDKPEEEKAEDKESEGEEAKDEKAKAFTIDVEGAERRSFQLPVSPGGFRGLAVNDKGHLIYASGGGRGAGQPPAIKILDLSADKPSEQTVVEGAAGFGITPKGDKLVVLRGSSFYVIPAMPNQKLTSAVSTDGMSVVVEPRKEWKQIFDDAWRFERDFFYDPTMHGVDWKAVKSRYEPMLEDCVSRNDVGFVIGEMIAELNVGHAYYRGPRGDSGPSVNVGTLGCLFELKDGAYCVSKIFEGAVWDVDARNPLRGVSVNEGDYILAVNGNPVDADRSIYASFLGLAGKTVTLSVSDKASGGEERDVVIEMLRSDSSLRYRAWIEANRQYIAEKTDNQVGYIYVPNTGIDGQNDLVRQFYGQLDKKALIIDDRWNGGGQIPTRFIELLNRPVTNYWARRDGKDWLWPPDSHQGPKCMLINGLAGSGGDMFPALFRQAGVGKLIGMRTWGGLVGITGGPSMVDGSSVTAPSFAFYENDGTWGIEGHGVDPDIEVVDDPGKMLNGADPQLDAAISHMLEEIGKSGFERPNRPAYPDRRKIGIKEADK